MSATAVTAGTVTIVLDLWSMNDGEQLTTANFGLS